jgi:hypothetical protein
MRAFRAKSGLRAFRSAVIDPLFIPARRDSRLRAADRTRGHAIFMRPPLGGNAARVGCPHDGSALAQSLPKTIPYPMNPVHSYAPRSYFFFSGGHAESSNCGWHVGGVGRRKRGACRNGHVGPLRSDRQLDDQTRRAQAGTSNQSFFNIEGSGHGTNASYGVADFSGAAFGVSGATAVSALTVTFNSLSSDASTALAALLNTGGAIRLVFTPEDAATAATYAGFTNTTLLGPQLSVTTTTGAPVPEPASLDILLALGGLLLAKRRCR